MAETGRIETIEGNLRDAYKQIVPGTMLHSDELMNARRNNPELRNQWFYTADGILYYMDGHKPMVAFTREKDNLVLRHIDEAYRQLTNPDYTFRPDSEEARASIEAQETLTSDFSDLQLEQDGDYSYFNVPTTGYDHLNAAQRILAERVYGQGDDFVANMRMLHDSNINETGIYLLSPDYVRKNAKKSSIGRASFLANFGNLSRFNAYYWDINLCDRLRGVRASGASTQGITPEGRDEQRPDLEQVLSAVLPSVPQVLHKKVQEDLRKLYKL